MEKGWRVGGTLNNKTYTRKQLGNRILEYE
jgi:hypothetical protein